MGHELLNYYTFKNFLINDEEKMVKNADDICETFICKRGSDSIFLQLTVISFHTISNASRK